MRISQRWIPEILVPPPSLTKYLYIKIFRTQGFFATKMLSSVFFRHLPPGGPGVFPTRRYDVAPCEGRKGSKFNISAKRAFETPPLRCCPSFIIHNYLHW